MNKQFSRYGILFVISAPSGAGKTTICDALRQTPDFVYSVSCTTRTPRAGEGVDVLIDIDTQGAGAIRDCGDEFIRRALSDVFIMPPNLEELRRRLTKRGTETPEQIELRLVNAAREMKLWRDYRYTIISQSMEEDLQKFRHIIGAERYLSSRLIQN